MTSTARRGAPRPRRPAFGPSPLNGEPLPRRCPCKRAMEAKEIGTESAADLGITH